MLHFDGACEPCNPGGTASYGWTLHSPDGHLIASGSGVVCSGPGATNNVAEYAGLEAGLQYLADHNLSVPLLCRGDSKLVVEQVNGRWKCKKPHLREACLRLRELLTQVGRPWELEWIPRELNSEADALSKSV